MLIPMLIAQDQTILGFVTREGHFLAPYISLSDGYVQLTVEPILMKLHLKSGKLQHLIYYITLIFLPEILKNILRCQTAGVAYYKIKCYKNIKQE